MLRRFWSVVTKDARVGARDQLITYLLLTPLLLGLMLALVMPLLERAPIVFAITDDLPAQHVAALEGYGDVERFPDRGALDTRVLRRDDVPGVTVGADGRIVTVVQGDESDKAAVLPAVILDYETRVRSGAAVTAIELESLGREATAWRQIAAALLAFSVVVLVGIAVGFTILEEKITGSIRALAVSPLRFAEYLAAKLGIGIGIASILVVPTVAIPVGSGVDYFDVWLATGASAPFALSFGLLVGASARDQLSAIAVVKAASPLWTAVPVLGFVLSSDWLWVLSPFPNHFAVQAYYDALQGAPTLAANAAIAFALGLVVLLGVALYLRRRLGF